MSLVLLDVTFSFPALQQTLDKEISNVATERAKLTSLARELEERIAKQKEDSDKNLKDVENKENAWRQEKEKLSNALKEEKIRLQVSCVGSKTNCKSVVENKNRSPFFPTGNAGRSRIRDKRSLQSKGRTIN